MKYSEVITFEQLIIVITLIVISCILIKTIRKQNEIIDAINKLKGNNKNE